MGGKNCCILRREGREGYRNVAMEGDRDAMIEQSTDTHGKTGIKQLRDWRMYAGVNRWSDSEQGGTGREQWESVDYSWSNRRIEYEGWNCKGMVQGRDAIMKEWQNQWMRNGGIDRWSNGRIQGWNIEGLKDEAMAQLRDRWNRGIDGGSKEGIWGWSDTRHTSVIQEWRNGQLKACWDRDGVTELVTVSFKHN